MFNINSQTPRSHLQPETLPMFIDWNIQDPESTESSPDWHCVCVSMRGSLSGTRSVPGWVGGEQSRGRLLNWSTHFHFLNQTGAKRARLYTVHLSVMWMQIQLAALIVPYWRSHKFILRSFSHCLFRPQPLISETMQLMGSGSGLPRIAHQNESVTPETTPLSTEQIDDNS